MNYFIKLIIIIIFFSTMSAMAQGNDLYNVKLKSGLVIKCELIKVVTDSFITIRQYGLVSTIKYSEISSIEYAGAIVKETPVRVTPGVRETPGALTPVERPVKFRKNIPDSGWSLGIQTGMCFGITDNEWPTVSILFRLSVLRRLSNKLQAGIVFGLDPYLQYEMVMGTIVGEARYHFEKNRPRSVFLYGQGGYGFNVNSENSVKEGGLHVAAGIGQSFRNRQQNIFSYMLGYRVQKAQEDKLISSSPQPDILRTYYHVFRRLEVKVEWRF